MDAPDMNAAAAIGGEYYGGALGLDSGARAEAVKMTVGLGGNVVSGPFPAVLPREYAYREKPVYEAVKRAFDILFAMIAILLASPVMLLAAIAIKLEDGGPVIYKRVCVGKNRKPYVMYKFRSMVIGADGLAEELFTPEQKAKHAMGDKFADDPRITKVGHVLRKTSVDELPQFICILKNDMSLIGPRPVTEREAATYGASMDQLLSTKPGITGYWQVYGRANQPYLSREAQTLQLDYVKQRGVLLDIKLFFLTIKAVVCGNGAR
ncbi:MAG: sugar transferase [Eubacteriales bacterium]|nr:sugar transferase [Eubacteriales bacterium]